MTQEEKIKEFDELLTNKSIEVMQRAEKLGLLPVETMEAIINDALANMTTSITMLASLDYKEKAIGNIIKLVSREMWKAYYEGKN
jgi:hypothetical protein